MNLKTTPQVAQELGIPVATLKDWLRVGKVEAPQNPTGHGYIWTEADIGRVRAHMQATGYIPGASKAGRPRKQSRK